MCGTGASPVPLFRPPPQGPSCPNFLGHFAALPYGVLDLLTGAGQAMTAGRVLSHSGGMDEQA